MSGAEEQYDLIVVGAGIVGCAIGHRLQRAGAKTLLIDVNPCGSGTTAAGMGHVLALDGSKAELALTAWSKRLWEQQVSSFPLGAECDPCGTLWVAETRDQLEQAAEKIPPWRALGIQCEMLDGHQLQQMEPSLRPGFVGALRVVDDLVVYPPAVCGALVAEFQALGGRLRLGDRVAKVQSGSVTLSSGETIFAPSVVSAAGVRALELLPPKIEVPTQLFPRKGHLAITTRIPRRLQHQVAELGYHDSAHGPAETSVAFNVQPRVTGQVLIGSSRQNRNSTSTIDYEVLYQMLERAGTFMPGLRTTPILRTWTGLRPATSDGLPLIGEVPGAAGVFLAAGHEGLGITTSLGTAEIIASALTGEACEIDAGPFLPCRSGDRGGVTHE